jgi:hypothetical protein
MKKQFLLLLVLAAGVISSCKKEDGGTDDNAFTALYFLNYQDGKLSKINLSAPGSFTNVATITDDHYSCIAYDPASGYVYIGNEPSLAADSKISRVKTDGSGTVEVLFDAADGVSSPTSMVIYGNKLIWANSGTDQIMTGNKDGSGTPTTLYGGAAVAGYSYGMAISGNKLYWSEFSSNVVLFTQGIHVGNLDGSGTPTVLYNATTDLADAMRYPSNIAISNNKIYWADEDRNAVGVAPLNGSGPITELYGAAFGINEGDGLAIDERTGKIYWSETGDAEIKRANLDGSSASAETLLTTKVTYGITLGR